MKYNEKYLSGEDTYLDYDKLAKGGAKIIETDYNDPEVAKEMDRVAEKYTSGHWHTVMAPDGKNYVAVCCTDDIWAVCPTPRIEIEFSEPNAYGAIRVYYMSKMLEGKYFIFNHLYVSAVPTPEDGKFKTAILKALELGREFKKGMKGQSNIPLDQLRAL